MPGKKLGKFSNFFLIRGKEYSGVEEYPLYKGYSSRGRLLLNCSGQRDVGTAYLPETVEIAFAKRRIWFELRAGI